MKLSRTVVVLGTASLLTDLSSDMIYPLLPAFLAVSLGAGAVGLGTMEGVAEALASLLKIGSGKLADRWGRHKPLVVAGYGISGLARPLIGFAAAWPLVLILRWLDRIGKGVRTPPRDAMIADVTPSELRGRAYGLHRAMDNAGAVLGPLTAAALLAAGLSVRQVFWSAAVPAAVVILVLLVGVPETKAAPQSAREETEHTRLVELPPDYRRFLAVVVVFSLGNSSDVFLLLRLSEAGLSAASVTLVWAGHNLLRSFAVYVGGTIADRVDRKRLLGIGWLIYLVVYAGFAFAGQPLTIIGLLLLYAVHYGAVEPSERALVASYAPADLRASSFGWYHAAVGLAQLPASTLFGVAWVTVGHSWAFAAGAGLSGIALVALSAVRSSQR